MLRVKVQAMEPRGGHATTSYSPAAFPSFRHSIHPARTIKKRLVTQIKHSQHASRGLVCQMSQSSGDGREAVQILMDLAKLGDLEGLLDLVPDSVVEKALERKQQMRYEKSCLQQRALGSEVLQYSSVGDAHVRLTCVPLQPLCQDG